MRTRPLGNTGLNLPILAFGASSLGQEFRHIDVNEGLRCVRVALDCGMNYIDTAAFYGRGMSEVLLGVALEGVRRDSYILSSKLGRYSVQHFDYSPRRVEESVDISLERLHTDYLDIMIVHDIEFWDMDYIIRETLPALRNQQKKGKVRYVAVSGYPMHIFKYVLDRAELDVILTYSHYTLINQMLVELLPYLKQKGVGVMNAAPFSARLLTNAELPPWHKAPPLVRETCRKAALHCRQRGSDIAKVALQFSLANEDTATCISGSADPGRVARWAQWAAEPVDQQLLKDVLAILEPIHNWFYIEGRPENNDPLPPRYAEMNQTGAG